MWAQFYADHIRPLPPDINTEYKVSESLKAAETPPRHDSVYSPVFDYGLHTRTNTQKHTLMHTHACAWAHTHTQCR